jgi:hypothetical protein
LAGAVWVTLILKGYADLGRLPVPGEPVNINFEGLDVIIGLTLIIMYVFPFIWAGLTAGIIAFKGVRLNRTSIVIGIVGIVLDVVIIFSPQFRWIMD